MPRLHHDKYTYDDDRDFLHLEYVFHQDYVLLMDIALLSDTFLDLQKDIFQEYFSLLVDRLEAESKEKNIRRVVEHTLQELNAKLTLFADKIDKVDYFAIKGSVRVFFDEVLIGSLIGDTSLMIFREESLYYAVSNDYDNTERIDLFSEFVEGAVAPGDEMIILGYDIHTVFDKQELKKFNNLFSLQHGDVVDFLEEILSMRIDMSLATFMLRTVCGLPQGSPDTITKKLTGSGALAQGIGNRLGSFVGDLVPSFAIDRDRYRYPLVISLLSVVILGLGIGLLFDLTGENTPTMEVNGTQVDVTIHSIKKDLAHFQRLDPTSDEKSHMYRQLIDKLDFLDSEGMWPNDVKELRTLVETSYQKGFNIVYANSLDKFTDKTTGASSEIFAFNDNESGTIGSPVRLFFYDGRLHMIGSQGSLLDVIDNDRRGTLVTHDFDGVGETGFEHCTLNLLANGAYCASNTDDLYNVTKAGLEGLTIDSGEGFPTSVADLGTFGKSNFYVLTRSLYDNQRDVYIRRYSNVVGSQTQFTRPTDYPLSVVSGSTVDPVSMKIDTNFLVWDSGQVHQRYRAGQYLTLTDRPIDMLGGDMTTKYSDSVEILTHDNTRYILLFDKENQTLTVYDTVGMKTNDSFAQSYQMSYVMRFIFNLSHSIVDVALDDTTANAPVVYVLTEKGINKIKVIDLIDDIINPTA